MRKIRFVELAKVEAAKFVAGCLVVICLIFSGIMPLVLGAVLRTVAVLLSGYYCFKSAESMIEALVEMQKQPRRHHVIVDLEKGTIKET